MAKKEKFYAILIEGETPDKGKIVSTLTTWAKDEADAHRKGYDLFNTADYLVVLTQVIEIKEVLSTTRYEPKAGKLADVA